VSQKFSRVTVSFQPGSLMLNWTDMIKNHIFISKQFHRPILEQMAVIDYNRKFVFGNVGIVAK
jgi:hypothetical protein